MLTTFVAVASLRIKTSFGIKSFRPGDTFVPRRIEPIRALIESGRIRPAGHCTICHTYAWWFSIHGVLACGTCHPPTEKSLVKIAYGAQMSLPGPFDREPDTERRESENELCSPANA